LSGGYDDFSKLPAYRKSTTGLSLVAWHDSHCELAVAIADHQVNSETVELAR
jgi:hypothetical protein